MRMNALVNNLLDMARLQSGAVRSIAQWQPLEEVVGSALRRSRPCWRASGAHRPAADLPLLTSTPC
jgi:two-component system sensor histidine kinase KdpD